MSNELTAQEAKILEAAADLLREARRGARFLDVVAKALSDYTRDEATRKAWDTFERELTRLGFQEDPAAYCQACSGEGELRDEADRLHGCLLCEGHGFTGYPRGVLPPLYLPTDPTALIF
jgi:hypothetical protein